VVLEYSVVGETNWTVFGTYVTWDYALWRQRVVEIPPEAQTAGTQFRWRQLGFSLGNWALDDVVITIETRRRSSHANRLIRSRLLAA